MGWHRKDQKRTRHSEEYRKSRTHYIRNKYSKKYIYFKENRERQKILANSYQVKFGTKKFK